jgi:hypothetical protein
MLFDGLLLACCLLVCLVPYTTLPQTISIFFTTSHIRQFFRRFAGQTSLLRVAHLLSLIYTICDVVKKVEMVLFPLAYSTIKQQEAISINQ